MSVDVAVSPHQATTDNDIFQTVHTNKSHSPPPHSGFLHGPTNRQIDRQSVGWLVKIHGSYHLVIVFSTCQISILKSLPFGGSPSLVWWVTIIGMLGMVGDHPMDDR